jgi:hypothetical protein
MKQTTLRTLLAAAVLAAVASHARAGEAISHEVSVNDSVQSASGSMAGARYSADGTQWIGCTVRIASPSTPAEASCKAVSKSERMLSCKTTDPAFVQLAEGQSDYAWIYFKCNGTDLIALTIGKSSYSLP